MYVQSSAKSLFAGWENFFPVHVLDCKIFASREQQLILTWLSIKFVSSCKHTDARTTEARQMGSVSLRDPVRVRQPSAAANFSWNSHLCAHPSVRSSSFFKQSKARKMVAQFLSKESPGRISSSPSSIISSALLIRAQGQLTSWKLQL